MIARNVFELIVNVKLQLDVIFASASALIAVKHDLKTVLHKLSLNIALI